MGRVLYKATELDTKRPRMDAWSLVLVSFCFCFIPRDGVLKL